MRKPKVVAALVAAVSLFLTSLVVSLVTASPARATWTSPDYQNFGGWASVELGFYTVPKSGGGYWIQQVRVCMSPGDVNTKSIKQQRLQVTGSNGVAIAFLTLPDTGRNQCTYSNFPSGTSGGSGAYGHLDATINIDPWVPYPDYHFSMCRKVVSGARC